MTFLAPAGVRLHLTDLGAGIRLGLEKGCASTLVRQLAHAATRDDAWLFSTGRAAMTVALQAIRSAPGLTGRSEVVIPGYTCYSVAAAVQRAGLTPRLCDVDPYTLSLDPDSLQRIDFGRVLAVISANLYGLPNRLLEIENLARANGAFMIDDAAQALGARYMDRAVGAFGDAGLYSFDKGKVITTLQGGALVAGREFRALIVNQLAEASKTTSLTVTLALLAKLAVYVAGLHPSIYDMVRRLPLGLGTTPYDTHFPIRGYSRVLAGVALQQLRRLDSLNEVRRRNAAGLTMALTGCRSIKPVWPLPEARPVFVRYPVLVDARSRQDLITAFEQGGIGATGSYPAALIDVPQVKQLLPQDQAVTPGAREVAGRIVTLPTHGYVPTGLGDRILRIADSLNSSTRVTLEQ